MLKLVWGRRHPLPIGGSGPADTTLSGMGGPRLIIVSGPPGSGKTTLARILADQLGCPLLSRDAIKQGLVSAHPGYVATTNDRLTLRAYTVFFDAIRLLSTAGVTLVVEAAFQHELWVAGLGDLADSPSVRIVRCSLRVDLARSRTTIRLAEDPSRSAHADAEYLASASSFDAIHLAAPTLDVDTADGYAPDVSTLVDFCADSHE